MSDSIKQSKVLKQRAYLEKNKVLKSMHLIAYQLELIHQINGMIDGTKDKMIKRLYTKSLVRRKTKLNQLRQKLKFL
jgi:hypothetical protein